MTPDSEFSFRVRPSLIKRLKNELWDLVVIGGGITGAAVARNAALRGLKVALVEAEDFASGTSSGSSKLLHGGIRYLENFEFKLVFEAIQEREKLIKLYAPLVKNIDFVFPTYSDRHPSRLLLNMGLTVYDSFSGFNQIHKNLNSQSVSQRFPFLKKENVTGACIYTDSFAEDFRLVIEIIKSAYRSGACAVSQLKVQDFELLKNEKHLNLIDHYTDEKFAIRTKTIFNCSGPFSDRIRRTLDLPPRMRLTQGVHFLVPHSKIPVEQAFVLSDPKHNRILFVIPWGAMTYIGTTDTVVAEPEEARARKEDLDYVLELFHQFFEIKLERKDIVQSWAAVRPLIAPQSEESTSKISRDFVVEESPKNIFHILGGKLTSHRVMAQDALNKYEAFYSRRDPTDDELLLENNIERPLDEASRILYSIDHEMALTPLDHIRRRSSMYYLDPRIEEAMKALEIFRKTMALGSERLDAYKQQILRSFDWDQAGY